MLRAYGFDDAAVLDGGWRKWIADGRVVSTAPPDYARATFEARPRSGLIATKDEVLAGMEQDNTCLICGLSPKEYSGEVTTYGRPGHIPSSSNVPARHLVNRETHEFLPLHELQELVEPTGRSGHHLLRRRHRREQRSIRSHASGAHERGGLRRLASGVGR